MAARFFGRYEHTIDPKGRLILPSKYRVHFPGKGFLGFYKDEGCDEGCLMLWPEEEFNLQMNRWREQLERGGALERNDVRKSASSIYEVDIDSTHGRVNIPSQLRKSAKLLGDGPVSVMVSGIVDHLELWNPSLWVEKVGVME
ncbi:MAG: hypothetical protein M1483_06790 [Actinobacteria bacterium]|jgi:MraZ protein|nr:hypothetical protein [Actinomycetota bacterium]MCL6105314.1 hypothetical protein [Actinomycetota bacterium]